MNRNPGQQSPGDPIRHKRVVEIGGETEALMPLRASTSLIRWARMVSA